MKVAIISDNKQSAGVDSYSEQALGPAYVAQATKNSGHDVKLYHNLPDIEELLEFDAVGFSVNSQDVPKILTTAKQIKKQKPKLITVAGGPHVSGEIKIRFSKEYVKGLLEDQFDLPIITSSWIDATVLGEGEYLPEILDGFEKDIFQDVLKKKGLIITSRRRIQNLDSLPFPTKFRDPETFSQPTDTSKRKFLIPIIESRGCPGQGGKTCDFCSSEASWGRVIRYRSGKNILQEVEEVAENYNLPKENTRVFFDGLELMANRKDFANLMSAFENTFYELESCGDLRLATPQTLDLMRSRGYGTVMWGIESLDPKILKKYKPGLTLNQVEKGLTTTHKFEIKNMGMFMVGFPEETEKSIREWIKRINNLPLDSLRVSIVTPFPGTQFRRDLLNKDYKIEPYSTRYDTSHLVYNHKNISKQRLEDLREEIAGS